MPTMRSLILAKALLIFVTPWAYSQDRAADGSMGMRVTAIKESAESITVETTAARFQLSPVGIITAWQLIPEERKILDIKFAAPIGPLKVKSNDGVDCTITAAGLRLRIQGDSVLVLNADGYVRAIVHGFLKPEYVGVAGGRWLAIDSTGGFGVYCDDALLQAAPTVGIEPDVPFTWARGAEAWVSVFPPRAYNQERARWSIAREGANLEHCVYPSDDSIAAAAKHCQVYCYDSWYAPRAGAKYPDLWCVDRHEPGDEQEFNRIRDTARKHGMKFMVYLSPFYSTSPDIIAEIKRVIAEHDVDGLYFDGVTGTDFRKTHRILREARRALGDERLLMLHNSFESNDTAVFYPFNDAYADYTFRGEAGTGADLERFVKWNCRGRNISNAAGYWCYSFTGGVGRTMVPSQPHIELALRNNVYFPRYEGWWREELAKIDPELADAEVERFDEQYYGLFNQSQQ